MKYQEAIDEIAKTLPEVAEFIKTHVSALNAESADRRVKLTEATRIVEALKALAGAEEDLIKFATETKKKAESSGQSATELQAQLDAAIALANTHQRQYLLLKASQVLKCNERALNKMLEGVSNDKIEVTEETVKIDGKTVNEYVGKEGDFWLAALFGAKTEGSPGNEPLPTGGPTPENKLDPAGTYIDARASEMMAVLNKTAT